jgi:hypothetical protein
LRNELEKYFRIKTIKMNKLFYNTSVLISLILFSCDDPFVNKKTSEIGSIYAECLDKNAWDTLFSRYSINNIKDTIFAEALIEMNNQHFGCRILYLQDDPVELIGADYYSVRYVFNPKLSSEILNGFTLWDSEKNRISNRVQKLLMEFQCKEGKEQSLKEIKSRKEEIN